MFSSSDIILWNLRRLESFPLSYHRNIHTLMSQLKASKFALNLSIFFHFCFISFNFIFSLMNEAKLLVDRGFIYYISEERYVLKKLLLPT